MSRPRFAPLVFTLVLVSACGSDDGGSTGPGLTQSTSQTTFEGSTTDATTGDDDPTTVGDGDGDSTAPGDGDGGPGEGYCGHQCSVDADCLIDGMDIDLSCVDNLCTSDLASECSSDDECVALLSGWTVGDPCTAGGNECAVTQVCIEVEGAGHCAYTPGEFIDCATLQMDEIPTVDIDGNPTTVCGNANAICTDGAYCIDPCQSDDACTSAAFPVCNPNTGLCGCGSDSDCATIGESQFSVCNPSTGICGCGSDQDCIDGNVGDLCTSLGVCGCTDDSACAGIDNHFDGGMISCLPLN